MCSIILHPNDQTTTTKEVNETAVSVNRYSSVSGGYIVKKFVKLIWYSISRVFWTLTNLKIFYPFFHSTTTTNINGVDRGPREELLYDIQRVKKAGNFLEDIRIFLSGFHENEFEKIRLAIQTAGGVSLSQLTSSVTVSIIISVSGSYEF